MNLKRSHTPSVHLKSPFPVSGLLKRTLAPLWSCLKYTRIQDAHMRHPSLFCPFLPVREAQPQGDTEGP